MINNKWDKEPDRMQRNKPISWTAILVGALTALGLIFLLNLFGMVILLNVFKTISTVSMILVVSGMLLLIIGIAISMIGAGYVAGYLGRLYSPERNLGIIYGFTTWVAALILGVLALLALSQSAVIYTNVVSKTVVAMPNSVNQITTPFGTTKISPPLQQGDKTAVEINVTPTNLSSGAFIMFLLFLFGALFSCIGASWGMRCSKDECTFSAIK